MKKLLLGSVALIALAVAGSASAADMPVKAPPPAWSGFYFGIEGGGNWFLHGSSGTNVAGGGFNDYLTDIGGGGGFAGTVAAGYRMSQLWRADVTYTYLRNNLKWTSVPPAGVNTFFTSRADSSVVLANVYLHGRGWAPNVFTMFDPFIGAGVGVARNRLRDIQESSAAAGVFALPADGSKTNFAARLGGGVDVNITRSFTWTTSANVYYLGAFQSGDSRSPSGGGAASPINPWIIDKASIFSLTTGLRIGF